MRGFALRTHGERRGRRRGPNGHWASPALPACTLAPLHHLLFSNEGMGWDGRAGRAGRAGCHLSTPPGDSDVANKPLFWVWAMPCCHGCRRRLVVCMKSRHLIAPRRPARMDLEARQKRQSRPVQPSPARAWKLAQSERSVMVMAFWDVCMAWSYKSMGNREWSESTEKELAMHGSRANMSTRPAVLQSW